MFGATYEPLVVQDFPWSHCDAVGPQDWRDPSSKMAHLLAVASRLAYHDAGCVQHVVQRLWGCVLVAAGSCLPAHQHRAQDYATSWCADRTKLMCTSCAVKCVFRSHSRWHAKEHYAHVA